jgi:hypothetical protein
MLGNTAFWNYFVSKVTDYSRGHQVCKENIHAIIQKIVARVPVGLIESNAAETIKHLQAQGIWTFGLTARCINPDYMPSADRGTYEHLKSVKIDFTQHPLMNKVNQETARFFSYGIIFTDHQEKGPYLEKFLQNMDLRPEKIVFIDDNVKQIKSVEKSLEKMGIPFIGYRYSNLDHFHTQFDPLIVNIQLEALIKNNEVLSDEEAVKISQSKVFCNSDYFVDELIKNNFSLLQLQHALSP